MKIVIDKKTKYTSLLPNYDICKISNVIDTKYKICEPIINVEYNEIQSIPLGQCEEQNDVNYYYIMECPGDSAFAHWIYECFIYIPILKLLLLKNPNIKIFCRYTQKFIKNFINLFIKNVTIVNEINPNNICYFTRPFSLNDVEIDLNYFDFYINLYLEYIDIKIPFKDNKKYNIIFLPRNTKDNYKPNDRIINGSDDIENNIKKIGGLIIDTYDLDDIEKQFDIIRNSNIIILDFGSSYFVNGIIAFNSNIIVLDTNGFSSQLKYPSIKKLHDLISVKNNVNIIQNYKIIYDDIKHFL